MTPRAAVAAAASALLAAGCATARQGLRPSPLVGQTVEIKALDLGGSEVRLPPDGGDVRVVDFWATWCDPCREQLPFLERLAERYGPEGLSVYGVSFDEDRAALDRFLEATPVSFSILWDKGGAGLAEKLEVTRLPTTIVVDRKGVVRDVHLGYARDDEGKIEAMVQQLLAER